MTHDCGKENEKPLHLQSFSDAVIPYSTWVAKKMTLNMSAKKLQIMMCENQMSFLNDGTWSNYSEVRW